MSQGLIKKDWFLASLITLAILAAYFLNNAILVGAEQVLYDTGVSMKSRNRVLGEAEKIAIIAIDDRSIKEIGRWPWSRSVHARLLERLAKGRPKVVDLQVYLTEEQDGAALGYVREARGEVRKMGRGSQQRKVLGLLAKAEGELNNDAHLAHALGKQRNMLMPMYFNIAEPQGETKGKLPGYITRNRITNQVASADAPVEPLRTDAISTPLPVFAQVLGGIGFGNYNDGDSNGVRSQPLVLEHQGDLYPSLTLLMAARSHNLRVRRIKVDRDKGVVQLGKLKIKTDRHLRMYPGFYQGEDGKPAFATYSYVDVLNGKLPVSAFRNKIVIIGPQATGVGTPWVTPISNDMSGAELNANIVASILNQDFYTRPEWSRFGTLILMAAVWFYLAALMPRFGVGSSAFVSFAILVALVVTGLVFLLAQKVWLQTMTPVLLLVTGHVVLIARRFLSNEHLKAHVESESAETNRMLGLTFQGQGQLDMALDKFKKLPVDNSVLELIYNLALDFERKRQFHKASAVYDYILSHKPKFRDVKERKQRAAKVEGTLILGGGGGMSAAGTMMLAAGDQKPTLGRYVVEQELGRGAMGTVYLGKDPKINRTVAIKTLDLTSEFEESEIQGVKDRFFREAETAGRLNHPNIVTIYDAGEEHDLAYIAMEFLEGADLTESLGTKKELPVHWVLNIISQCADALDYAHKQQVVHRDIKPANIMYNNADKSVKVTDFGIARITASNRTKTGVVLGTPSYMSPEQLSGKRVDGRSDLFSLGVTMFELLTKQQPFGGDSLATLMYQIANEKHPDINSIRKGLPRCVKMIIDKALQKNPDKRYQSGAEFKEAVDKCLNTIKD